VEVYVFSALNIWGIVMIAITFGDNWHVAC